MDTLVLDDFESQNVDADPFETLSKNIDDNLPIQIRRRRYIRNPQINIGQSPLSVRFAKNYNEKENKDWVKPLFSSIVYRLPVSQLI